MHSALCGRVTLSTSARKIGTFDPTAERWHERYAELRQFRRDYGHALVPNLFVTGKVEALGRWVRVQRTNYVGNTMRPDRQQPLEDLGLCLAIKDQYSERKDLDHDEWNRYYRALVTTDRDDSGYVQLPEDNDDDFRKNEPELHQGVQQQKEYYRTGRIFPFRIERLDAVAFLVSRDVFRDNWMRNFRSLQAYRDRHGTTTIQHAEEGNLLRWTRLQLRLHRHGLCTAKQRRFLDSIGFGGASSPHLLNEIRSRSGNRSSSKYSSSSSSRSPVQRHRCPV